MKIEAFYNPPFSNLYLIEKEESVILIDPSHYTKKIAEFLTGKKLIAILLTHGHFDHFASLPIYIQNYPDVKFYLSGEEARKLSDVSLSYADYFVKDATPYVVDYEKISSGKLNLGPFEIEVYNFPGHTSCGMGFLIEDALFIGDTLFSDGVGRWDLATASYPDLLASLERIKKMDDNLVVYPGHEDIFRLGDAKKNNKYLKN